MKLKFAVFSTVLACAFTIHAQTFTRYTLTNFDENGNSSISFCVPSNTLFKGITTFGDIQAIYPESPYPVYIGAGQDANHTVTPVLGPAKIIFTGYLSYPETTNGISVLLAEFDPVNTTPAIEGFAVQPANSTAQIGLETSTDLKSWQSTTNGVYGLTNSARFFRMNLSVSP